MLTRKVFDDLFDMLISNPWEFLPDKSRLTGTRHLFFEKLKTYHYGQVKYAVDQIINDKDQKCLPSIQRLIYEIENAKATTNYKNKKELTSIDKRGIRIFKRLMRESRLVISKYKNDRLRLTKISLKYENIRRILTKNPKKIYYIKNYAGNRMCKILTFKGKDKRMN